MIWTIWIYNCHDFPSHKAMELAAHSETRSASLKRKRALTGFSVTLTLFTFDTCVLLWFKSCLLPCIVIGCFPCVIIVLSCSVFNPWFRLVFKPLVSLCSWRSTACYHRGKPLFVVFHGLWSFFLFLLLCFALPVSCLFANHLTICLFDYTIDSLFIDSNKSALASVLTSFRWVFSVYQAFVHSFMSHSFDPVFDLFFDSSLASFMPVCISPDPMPDSDHTYVSRFGFVCLVSLV